MNFEEVLKAWRQGLEAEGAIPRALEELAREVSFLAIERPAAVHVLGFHAFWLANKLRSEAAAAGAR